VIVEERADPADCMNRLYGTAVGNSPEMKYFLIPWPKRKIACKLPLGGDFEAAGTCSAPVEMMPVWFWSRSSLMASPFRQQPLALSKAMLAGPERTKGKRSVSPRLVNGGAETALA
jgi:hypothetical protein